MQLKPITTIIVLFLVLASLLESGCTSTAKDVDGAVNPTQATAVPTADDVQVRVSASHATVPQQIGTCTPKAGYKYVAFNCTVKNIATSRLVTNPFDWQLRDTAGGVYQPATPTFSSDINGLQVIQTRPGMSSAVW
ncbi:MAG: hypothetical protein WCB79_09595 [Halobacteriota archaeon]